MDSEENEKIELSAVASETTQNDRSQQGKGDD